MFEINPDPNHLFKPMYLNKGLIICIGGRGGMKSYETSKWAASRLVSNFNTRGVLIREEAVTIQNSILNEVKSRLEMINEKTEDYYSNVYDIQDTRIKNKLKDRDAIFTLGIRDSANYKQARLKSLSELDFSITEEAEDIRDDQKYFKLIDSIRHSEAVNIVNLNVPDIEHWIVKRFFNTTESEHDGWFRLEPKEMEGVTVIQSSYKDNAHLPKEIVKRYESYGDPTSPFYNQEYYLSQILGLCSSGRFGLVYTHIQPCTLQEYKDFDFEPFYGLDFGYSNDPTALLECKYHNNKIYSRELLYQQGLTNQDISQEFARLGIKKTANIYADSAEPKSIEELRRLGWKVLPAEKGTDSVNAGIQFLKGLQLFDLEGSPNLWEENRNYIWQVDRDKKPTNKPEDKNNHLQDARRYAAYTHLNKPKPSFTVYV